MLKVISRLYTAEKKRYLSQVAGRLSFARVTESQRRHSV